MPDIHQVWAYMTAQLPVPIDLADSPGWAGAPDLPLLLIHFHQDYGSSGGPVTPPAVISRTGKISSEDRTFLPIPKTLVDIIPKICRMNE